MGTLVNFHLSRVTSNVTNHKPLDYPDKTSLLCIQKIPVHSLQRDKFKPLPTMVSEQSDA